MREVPEVYWKCTFPRVLKKIVKFIKIYQRKRNQKKFLRFMETTTIVNTEIDLKNH